MSMRLFLLLSEVQGTGMRRRRRWKKCAPDGALDVQSKILAHISIVLFFLYQIPFLY